MGNLKTQIVWLFAVIILNLSIAQACFAALFCPNVHSFDTQVFWIQIQDLKQINSDLAKIGGAHDFLAAANETIISIQKQNPSLFSLTRSTYKDIVITTEKPEYFNANILPLISKRVRTLKKSLYAIAGHKFEGNDIHVGKGANHLEAMLDLKLKNSNFKSWSEYQNELIMTFKKVDSYRKILKLNWIEFIESQNNLLKINNPNDITNDFEILKRLSNIADYLPGVEVPGNFGTLNYKELSWIHDYDRFKSNLGEYGTLIAIDMKGFGNISTLKRIEWIKNGANLKAIPELYAPTTRYLENTFNSLVSILSRELQIPESAISFSTSGDDGLFALPTLTAEQNQKLKQALNKLRSKIYFTTVNIDSSLNADKNISKAKAILLKKEETNP